MSFFGLFGKEYRSIGTEVSKDENNQTDLEFDDDIQEGRNIGVRVEPRHGKTRRKYYKQGRYSDIEPQNMLMGEKVFYGHAESDDNWAIQEVNRATHEENHDKDKEKKSDSDPCSNYIQCYQNCKSQARARACEDEMRGKDDTLRPGSREGNKKDKPRYPKCSDLCRVSKKRQEEVDPCPPKDPCAYPCPPKDPCADPCAPKDPCPNPCLPRDPCADPCFDPNQHYTSDDPCRDPCNDPCRKNGQADNRCHDPCRDPCCDPCHEQCKDLCEKEEHSFDPEDHNHAHGHQVTKEIPPGTSEKITVDQHPTELHVSCAPCPPCPACPACPACPECPKCPTCDSPSPSSLKKSIGPCKTSSSTASVKNAPVPTREVSEDESCHSIVCPE